jgi:hypothetical protein
MPETTSLVFDVDIISFSVFKISLLFSISIEMVIAQS